MSLKQFVHFPIKHLCNRQYFITCAFTEIMTIHLQKQHIKLKICIKKKKPKVLLIINKFDSYKIKHREQHITRIEKYLCHTRCQSL